MTVLPLDGGLEIRWMAPARVGNSDPSGYRVRYRPVGGHWVTMRNVSSPATVSALQNTALYEVQVRADGSGYEVWSPSSYATPSHAVGTAAAAHWLPNCPPQPVTA